MNIFVGNLSFDSTDADVKKLFEGFGSVASVRIVMEKKGTKSRGFGFVQMPDEQQAQTAIAALNGKEFMGRPLNVSPACPKPEVERDRGEAKKSHFEIKVKGQEHPKKKGDQKGWYDPAFNPPREIPGLKPGDKRGFVQRGREPWPLGQGGSTKERGRYKTGRRSQSFMKRRAASGIVEEARPKQESRENPMRWRKKYEHPKPWQKSQGEHKPWKKAEGESRPWKKLAGESKPLKRKEGEFKPWRKPTGESKPWRNSGKRPRPRQSRIESRRKPGGYTR